MAKVKDVTFIKNAIKQSLKKLKDKYLDNFKHNYKLYSGEDSPKSKICESTVEPINLVYPTIELNKVELGFRNPKVIVKSTRKFYFFRKVRGSSNLQEIKPENYSDVFKAMIDGNLFQYSQLENGETVDYIILDGEKSARLAEGGLNTIIRDKGTEKQLELVKTDAFVARAGAAWVNYYSPFFLPTHETEYVKIGDICVSREVIGETVFFDDTIGNIENISKAKWVAKKFFLSLDDIEALKFIKDSNGDTIFKPDVIEKLIKKEIGGSIDIIKKQNEDNSRNSENIDDDRVCGYNFFEVWMRPSLKEQIDQNDKYRNGKMFYVIEDCDEEISEILPWPHKTDKFPLHLLYFNSCGSSLFPPSDIETYESLLAEYNLFKALTREAVDLQMRTKLIVNSERWINTDIEMVHNKLSDKDTRLIPISGATPNADIFQVKLNTSSEVWGIVNQTKEEIAKVSLNSEARLGNVLSRAPATGYAISQQALGIRTQSRQYLYSKFFNEIEQHVLALMQQYYNKSKMISLSGDLDGEWVELTREQIQGEYLTMVDVMSMNPSDIMMKTQRAMQLLNTVLSLFDNDKRYLKLLSEGKQVRISEILNEINKGLELNNEKIIENVPINVSQYAEQFLNQMLHLTPQVSGPAIQNIGGNISTNTGAPGATPLEQGEIMPPGGKPKVLEEEQMPVTQGNAGGGRT